MLLPPHSLQRLRWRPWSQMLFPPHSLHRAFFPHYDPQWAKVVEERQGECGKAQLVCLTDDGSTAWVSGDEVEDVEEP